MTPRRLVFFLLALLLTAAKAHAAGPTESPRRSPSAPSPARAIVLPNIVVNEALLERLSTRPVPLPGDLSPAQRNGLDTVARHLKAGNMGAAQTQWRNTLGSYVSKNTPGSNILSILHYVMKQSLVEQNEDKKYYLQKLKNRNKIADALAEEIKKLNDAMKELGNRAAEGTGSAFGRGKVHTVEVSTLVETPASPHPGSDNTIRIRWEKKRMDRAALQKQIRITEGRLASVRKDAQLANIDLQNSLQKQQQVLQTMSNISKMLHDTAMSVIRKIG